MAYIPKSKIKISETSGGEFVYTSNNKDYKGKYIETSKGLFYAGEDVYSLKRSNQLSPKSQNNNKTLSLNNKVFNALKTPKYKFLNKTQPPSVSTPKPTKKDYKKYKFNRYFTKKINSQYGYIEINKKTYESILGEEGKYDHNLYKVDKIEWALRGNTYAININTLIEKEKQWPGLSLIFKSLQEYKSDEPLGIEGNENYNLEIKPGFISQHLQEAIEFSRRKEEDKSPNILINKSNHTLYNIPDRKYLDGEPVPTNLPESYGYPRPIEKVIIEKQKCGNCYFNEMGYCSYWGAEVRDEYWSPTWIDNKTAEMTYDELTEDIKDTIQTKTNTMSSIGINKISPDSDGLVGY
jgi:hypothetical protein